MNIHTPKSSVKTFRRPGILFSNFSLEFRSHSAFYVLESSLLGRRFCMLHDLSCDVEHL